MENQRIRLSKSLLKNALINLLQTTPIEKITIYDLCKQAEINRTTFYKYYGSQYDLLAAIEEDMFNEMEELLKDTSLESEDSLTRVLNYIETERKKCQLLMNATTDTDFAERLFTLPSILDVMNRIDFGTLNNEETYYLHHFIYEGGYSIVKRWINKEKRETPEEIARLMRRVMFKLIPNP